MPTTVTKTVKSSGGNYTSLVSFEAGEQRDLVAADEIAEAECHGFDDNAAGNCVFDGWTTDATRFIRIRAPAGEYPTMPTASGKYRLIGNGDNPLQFAVDYVRVERITVMTSGSFSGGIICIGSWGFGSREGIHIIGCLLAHNATTTGDSGYGLILPSTDADHDIRVINTVVYRDPAISVAANDGIRVYGGARIYNCSVAGKFGTGISGFYGANNPTVRNCLSYGATTADFWDSFNTKEHNASKDGTAPGANSLTSIADPFVDYNGGDLHLKAGSSLIGAGKDLSADADYPFAIDFDGQGRLVPWHIGADHRHPVMIIDFARHPNHKLARRLAV